MSVTKSSMTNGLLLTLIMLICGCLSVVFGKDLCWDIAHYHYYMPFAFLHARQGIDFWPNSYIHQFINPTIDLLSYFLIHSFTPHMAEFILGALHGINAWLLWLIARLFLPARRSLLLAALLACLGMYGSTALPGIGSFQNDNLVSIFVLGFVLLQIKSIQYYLMTNKLPMLLLLLSGLLLGLGFGLKLTAGIYIVGGLVSIFFLPLSPRDKIKWLLLVGIASTCGLLITAGHWMYMMWQQHHNPFFPFFNDIFHSQDFMPQHWRDERFLPKTLTQTLFFPFYFALDGRTADAPFRDIRFPLVYFFFVLAGIQHWWRKRKTTVPQKMPSSQAWLFVFFIFSYLAWQYYFSIARYLVVLEMLAPLVIYLLVRQLSPNRYLRFAVLFTTFYALIAFLTPIPMIRAPWYETSFFNVQLPPTVTNTTSATVLIAYTAYVLDNNPRPQSYLIPFFPATWRFIGIPFWHQRYLFENKVNDKIVAELHKREDNIYLLTSDLNMPALYQAALSFGLKPNGACENIFSDRQAVTHQETLLCPVTR